MNGFSQVGVHDRSEVSDISDGFADDTNLAGLLLPEKNGGVAGLVIRVEEKPVRQMMNPL